MSIPQIDFSRANNSSQRGQLLHELRHALLEVGFLYIYNHGLDPSIVHDMIELLPKMFALPEGIKDQVALVNSPHFLGYSRFGTEITAKIPDQREQFEFANELPDSYHQSCELPLYTRLQGPNQWLVSSSVPRIRDIVEGYISALQELARRFLELVTEALGLEPGSLQEYTGPQDRLKLVHYKPAVDRGRDEASQGVGPHKDSSGWMTFLLQGSDPSVKGLQALSKNGQWVDVPPIPGTFVVNLGQTFEAVTNGVCQATTHRVLLPAGDYDRYSVPFFQGVRPNLRKEELKSLWEHFNEDKWQTRESIEGQQIDSPFLHGDYDAWGEAQLRTKMRSHRDVAKKHYPDVYDLYVNSV